MDIRFQNLGPEQWKAEIMLAPACEGEDILRECPELDKAAPWLTVAPAMRDFKGKDGELALLHGHPELPVPRVLAVGLGPREKVDAARLRAAIAAAVQRCRGLSLNSILLPEPALSRLPGGRERLVEECVYAAQLALYRFTALKKPQEDEPADPQWLALGFDGQSVPDGAHDTAARRSARPEPWLWPGIWPTCRATCSIPKAWPSALWNWAKNWASPARCWTKPPWPGKAWARCWPWARGRPGRPAWSCWSMPPRATSRTSR